jgi:hypothetical protein
VKLSRVSYLTANTAFLLTWLSFCTRTVVRWQGSTPTSEFWAAGCAAMFLLLWFYMLREKNSTLAVVTMMLTLLASTHMTFHY